METDALRKLVKATATGTPHARIWPNGLGFDSRGTSYAPVVDGPTQRITWYASRSVYDQAEKVGHGPTPDLAKRAARIGRIR